jgi:hypothetical protein
VSRIRYYSTKEIASYIGNKNLEKFKNTYMPIGKHNHMQIFCYEDIIHYMTENKMPTDEFLEKHNLEDRKMDYIKFVEPELFSYTIYEDGTITKYDNTEITGSVGKHGYYEFGTNSSFAKILKIRLKHRVIAHALFGDIAGKEIDHINRDKLNNSINNIRIISKSGNILNRGKYRGHMLVKNLLSGESYLTDNIRLLERTFLLPISNAHMYRILLGQVAECKTTSIRLLLETDSEYELVKEMYNYAIKI